MTRSFKTFYFLSYLKLNEVRLTPEMGGSVQSLGIQINAHVT